VNRRILPSFVVFPINPKPGRVLSYESRAEDVL